MPSGRSATKSRHGCDRCKQRRVKCDEEAPCRNCIRRKEHCSLLDSQNPPSLAPQFRDNPILNIEYPEATTWAFDLYLMSHFSTSTVHTFSSFPSVVNAWQTTIVSDAALCPFLLHGMLAISALHLASRHGSANYSDRQHNQNYTHRDCMRAFRHHQDQAMPEYRRKLQALDFSGNEEFTVRTKEPWPAGPVYAMAVLLAFTSAAGVSDHSPSLDRDQRDQNGDDYEQSPVLSRTSSPASGETAKLELVFDHLMEIFVATRGTRVIVKAALDVGAFGTTAYRHLITTATVANQFPLWSTSPTISQWYETLRTQCLEELLGDGTVKRSEADICAAAITCLEEVHDGAARLLESKKERLWQLERDSKSLRYDFVWLMKWTTIVSQEFVALLHGRNPAALVVLAQFIATCDLIENQWYLEKWVKNALGAVSYLLGPSNANAWVDKIAGRWLSRDPDPDLASPGLEG